MVSCSNGLLGFFNVLTVIMSIPILVIGSWLAVKDVSECEKFFVLPIIAIGAALMVISLIGVWGACFGSNGMLFLYLILMALQILALIGFTGFMVAVTHKGTGEILSGKAYKEYRLVDYSHWLQQRVNDHGNWRKIKACLADMKICTTFADKYTNQTVEKFYSQHLTSIQSGCCKPSHDCNFKYVSPINWDKTNGEYKNTDCSKWENDADTLCYNCQSCKAGVIDQIKGYWRFVAMVNSSFLGLLIFFYLLGCCACCNNMRREDHDFKYNPSHNPYYYPHRGGHGAPPGLPRGP